MDKCKICGTRNAVPGSEFCTYHQDGGQEERRLVTEVVPESAWLSKCISTQSARCATLCREGFPKHRQHACQDRCTIEGFSSCRHKEVMDKLDMIAGAIGRLMWGASPE